MEPIGWVFDFSGCDMLTPRDELSITAITTTTAAAPTSTPLWLSVVRGGSGVVFTPPAPHYIHQATLLLLFLGCCWMKRTKSHGRGTFRFAWIDRLFSVFVIAELCRFTCKKGPTGSVWPFV